MTNEQATIRANTPPEISEALKFVQYAARQYTKSAIDDRWSEYGKKYRGLILEASAYAKLGSIFGWIECLRMIGKTAEAEKLANDIVARQLDFLAQYSGEVPGAFHIPGSLVRLYDDGTFAGFSFCAYCAVNWTDAPDAQRALLEAGGRMLKNDKGDYVTRMDYRNHKTYRYAFTFNGGLLYHGPAGDEVFAVTLGRSDCLWSIHT